MCGKVQARETKACKNTSVKNQGARKRELKAQNSRHRKESDSTREFHPGARKRKGEDPKKARVHPGGVAPVRQRTVSPWAVKTIKSQYTVALQASGQ